LAPGLLVYDLLFLVLASVTYAGAIRAGLTVFGWVATWVPWPVAVVPAIVAAVIALIAEVGVLTLLCPRLKPGRYPLMKGAMFWSWLLRTMLRRLLMAPGVKWIIFVSNVLRFLALRAMGARVAFTSSMSSDVDVLDPALLEVGAGAIIGARCFTSGHYVDRGQLVLGTIRVGEGAMLAAAVNVGPGVVVGRKAIVKPLAGLGPDVVIGDEAQVGGEALIDIAARVGDRADLGNRVHVRPGVSVPAGAKIAAGTVVS
jgi:carbonic anhydrase/acetyltransferase-like protein (isoleucine patch superfamily)